MDNKVILFVDTKKEKKHSKLSQNFFYSFKEHPFLHISKIQDDLPVNTYLIKLSQPLNVRVVC